MTEYDGKYLSEAWRAFAASDLGQQVLNGTANGKYLANRLEAAFISGWEAHKRYSAAGETSK